MASSQPIKVDAIFLLEDDHAAMQGLFSEFRKFHAEGTEGVDEMKQALIDDACAMLEVHTKIEEEIFYPAARECLPDDPGLMDVAEAQHHVAKEMINRIQLGSAADEETCALFLELSDAIERHIREEEDEMFPKVREAGMNTAEVGGRLKALKDRLEGELANADSSADGSLRQRVVDRITDYLGPTF